MVKEVLKRTTILVAVSAVLAVCCITVQDISQSKEAKRLAEKQNQLERSIEGKVKLAELTGRYDVEYVSDKSNWTYDSFTNTWSLK